MIYNTCKYILQYILQYIYIFIYIYIYIYIFKFKATKVQTVYRLNEN